MPEKYIEKKEKNLEEKLAEYGISLEKPNLYSLKTKQEAEDFRNPILPKQRTYGALPYYNNKEEALKTIGQEFAFFEKYYQPKEQPAWKNESYAEGLLYFQLKFNKKLSDFAQEILSQYPKLPNSQGKEISVFGLSGSGKSTLQDAIKDLYKEKAIIIDSDSTRYNLFGKMIKDVELENGASIEEVSGFLIHNRISGAMYFMLNYIVKELKKRGYTVIQSSTLPNPNADLTIYIEHPMQFDVLKVSEEEIENIADKLYTVTTQRVEKDDDFDWENCRQILDFNKMAPVTVRVPKAIHKSFIAKTKEFLQNSPQIKVLQNPKENDLEKRKNNLVDQLKKILET